MKRIYVAAPAVTSKENSKNIHELIYLLESLYDVYDPSTLKIPNAWNMPQAHWARCVFTQDVMELEKCDIVVVCDFGRFGSCGTAWEAGFAFARDIPVIVVRMPGVTEESLMVSQCATQNFTYAQFCILVEQGDESWMDVDRYKKVTEEVKQN